MLRAARRLGRQRRSRWRTTFLGAHALPPEADGDKDAYIDSCAARCCRRSPREGLADAVDAFWRASPSRRADRARVRGGAARWACR